MITINIPAIEKFLEYVRVKQLNGAKEIVAKHWNILSQLPHNTHTISEIKAEREMLDIKKSKLNVAFEKEHYVIYHKNMNLLREKCWSLAQARLPNATMIDKFDLTPSELKIYDQIEKQGKVEEKALRAKYGEIKTINNRLKELKALNFQLLADNKVWNNILHKYDDLESLKLPIEFRSVTSLNKAYAIIEKQSFIDKENLKLDLMNRTERVVGTITDASHVHFGVSGTLNGIVYGTRGNANVEAIFAGGYNIQCYHVRVLVKPIRN